MKRVSRRRPVWRDLLPPNAKRITGSDGKRVWNVPGMGQFSTIADFQDNIRKEKEKNTKKKDAKEENVAE